MTRTSTIIAKRLKKSIETMRLIERYWSVLQRGLRKVPKTKSVTDWERLKSFSLTYWQLWFFFIAEIDLPNSLERRSQDFLKLDHYIVNVFITDNSWCRWLGIGFTEDNRFSRGFVYHCLWHSLSSVVVRAYEKTTSNRPGPLKILLGL